MTFTFLLLDADCRGERLVVRQSLTNDFRSLGDPGTRNRSVPCFKVLLELVDGADANRRKDGNLIGQ